MSMLIKCEVDDAPVEVSLLSGISLTFNCRFEALSIHRVLEHHLNSHRNKKIQFEAEKRKASVKMHRYNNGRTVLTSDARGLEARDLRSYQ